MAGANKRQAKTHSPTTSTSLEDLSDRLKLGWSVADDVPVPFYNNRNGTFRRELLSLSSLEG